MKFFNKKFLKQEVEVKCNSEDFPSDNKSKLSYFVNQFLIWALIFLVIFAIFRTLVNDFNW